ncbi:cation transporter [Gordonia sp. QH-12]|uniref:DMT family transporter n=1 Tax=Gordonia TaxID=2053 RepID=UPI0007847068|nr:SMR family transporter [Gordonia sp. QH-12]KXT57207.1 cation transporter [Gordonia sp. QH-12]
MSWVWLLLSIASEVTGTLGLRAAGAGRRRWLILVGVGYTCAFVFLGFALDAGVPVSVAYGIWTAVGIVAIATLARVIWKDPLTGRMLLGTALIIAGVLLVELG